MEALNDLSTVFLFIYIARCQHYEKWYVFLIENIFLKHTSGETSCDSYHLHTKLMKQISTYVNILTCDMHTLLARYRFWLIKSLKQTYLGNLILFLSSQYINNVTVINILLIISVLSGMMDLIYIMCEHKCYVLFYNLFLSIQ